MEVVLIIKRIEIKRYCEKLNIKEIGFLSEVEYIGFIKYVEKEREGRRYNKIVV